MQIVQKILEFYGVYLEKYLFLDELSSYISKEVLRKVDYTISECTLEIFCKNINLPVIYIKEDKPWELMWSADISENEYLEQTDKFHIIRPVQQNFSW